MVGWVYTKDLQVQDHELVRRDDNKVVLDMAEEAAIDDLTGSVCCPPSSAHEWRAGPLGKWSGKERCHRTALREGELLDKGWGG
jgi:hypothetical protein